MKLFWFLIFAFTSAISAYSQTYSAVIVNEQNVALCEAQIQDTVNNVTTSSDANGKFTIEIKSNSVFQISLKGFENEFIDPFTLKDTIQLFESSRLLEGVLVSSEIVKPVLVSPGMNILDYHVYPDYMLVLYSEKGQKYLSINENSGAQKKLSLRKIKGKSLEEDCFGSIHLFTKDKAYRLAIGQEITFASEVSLAQFNAIIKPCEAVMKSNIIISKYSNHDQKYTLALKVKPETQFNPIFNIWDRETEVSASEYYHEIVGMYMMEVPPIDNIITNEIWDGITMRELAVNYEIMVLVGYYEAVASKPLDIQAFQVNEDLVLFDLCFDSLHVFSKNGDHLSAIHMSDLKDKKSKAVYMDQKDNTFYLIDFQRGYFQFSEINLSDGTLGASYEFEEIAFPKNIQIFNGSVYFLVPDGGFHKLYRFRLK